MRYAVLILSLMFSFAARAEQCGLFQIEDYGDRISFTLVDFATSRPQSVNYKITNQESTPVHSMVHGLCYCVEGDVTADDQFPGDLMYRLISIRKVTNGPTYDCSP